MSTSTDGFGLATRLAILEAGRDPQWVQQTANLLVAPQNSSYGTYLVDSVVTLLFLHPRELAHQRTARLTVSTVDLTTIYGTSIDGNLVNYDAGGAGAADLNDVINGIASALNAASSVNSIITASAVDDNDEVTASDATTVLIRGDIELDYSLNFAAGGTAVVEAVADASRFAARLWWYMGTASKITPPQTWAEQGPARLPQRRGWIERLATGGLSRLHVQIGDLTGHASDGAVVTYRTPDVWIGPCVSEA